MQHVTPAGTFAVHASFAVDTLRVIFGDIGNVRTFATCANAILNGIGIKLETAVVVEIHNAISFKCVPFIRIDVAQR